MCERRSFERFMELLVMHIDGAIAYTTGDPLRLLEDAQIIQPHLFPSVPRVLNRSVTECDLTFESAGSDSRLRLCSSGDEQDSPSDHGPGRRGRGQGSALVQGDQRQDPALPKDGRGQACDLRRLGLPKGELRVRAGPRSCVGDETADLKL